MTQFRKEKVLFIICFVESKQIIGFSENPKKTKKKRYLRSFFFKLH